jgi:hypothetical protein
VTERKALVVMVALAVAVAAITRRNPAALVTLQRQVRHKETMAGQMPEQTPIRWVAAVAAQVRQGRKAHQEELVVAAERDLLLLSALAVL